MKIFFALLISIFLGSHSMGNSIVTKEGNVTTIKVGTKIYKSAESKIGEAWSDIKNK